jgi:hypothetical protein
MRARIASLVALSAVTSACVTDDAATSTAAHLPTTSAVFAGQYRVPTSPELEAAAVFPVAEITWTVLDGVATLHYDLPVGLVGGVLEVDLSGPIDASGAEASLTGEVGTGTCVAADGAFACREVFTGLGSLPISMAVVEQVAATEYAGAVADRRAVASQFASDPIGIAEVSLSAPVVDDHGGRR